MRYRGLFRPLFRTSSGVMATEPGRSILAWSDFRNWNAELLKRALDRNELEALTLFANGQSADEIAAALNVSQGMAHHYLRVAARKLGARNRVHAVAVAVRNGLIKPTGGED
ncbi:MAG TPA: LuxR C-terminal-related transcriptional regulator [Pseudolabrys sp.]